MIPTPVLACFKHAEFLASLKLTYRYGAGHPSLAQANAYDCSGWVSAILNAGGILDSKVALGTRELAHWGDPGPGQFMTVWVINSEDTEHTLIEFKLPEHPTKRYSRAAHTGTICGWYDLPANFIDGYTARRRP